MLLRVIGEETGETYDFSGINGDGGDGGGIAAGKEIIAFADALLGTDDAALDAARVALRAVVGDEGLVDAAGVAASFNGIDRIADATGIPLEDAKQQLSQDLRTELNIDAYAAARV
jgi:hypothetical protein